MDPISKSSMKTWSMKISSRQQFFPEKYRKELVQSTVPPVRQTPNLKRWGVKVQSELTVQNVWRKRNKIKFTIMPL